MNFEKNTDASRLVEIADMYLLREDSKQIDLSKASYVFVLKAFEHSKEIYWIDQDDNFKVEWTCLMKNEDIEKQLVKVSSGFLEKVIAIYNNKEQTYYQNYKDDCKLCELELEKLTK